MATYKVDYDNLVYGTEPTTDVFTVTIRQAVGSPAELKRGTVLALSTGTSGDHKYVALGNQQAESEDLTANCILADDVTVGTSADVQALAYRTGHFNAQALQTVSEHPIDAKDKEALRDVGILLSDAL